MSKGKKAKKKSNLEQKVAGANSSKSNYTSIAFFIFTASFFGLPK